MPRSSPERSAAVVFALARTLLCGYRALEQSLTVDEASTFNNYLHGPWARIYENYDPNNHLLYSLLDKLLLAVFPLSEFTLRLPSVVAGFFLVLGIYWVLEITVSSRWIRWVALFTLSVYPMLLDMNIAARGYGLALACLTWAIYFVLRGNGIAAGVLLGLGVSANLTIAFPALGVMACPLVLSKGSLNERAQFALQLAIPAGAIIAAICYPALSKAHTAQFYVGEPTIGKAMLNMVFTSLRSTVDRDGLFGSMPGVYAVQYVVLPALMVYLLATGFAAFGHSETSRASLAPLLTLLVSLCELVAVHYLFGLNYPVDRVGLYLVLLFGLAWAAAAAATPSLPWRAVNAALAAAIALQFLTEFETGYFGVWAFDLPMKQVAQKLRDDTQGKTPGTVSVSATWYHQPALEFYRYYYRIDALKPVERRDRTALDGFDYYVLNLRDDAAVQSGNTGRLTPLLREPLSGVLLAKEPAPAP